MFKWGTKLKQKYTQAAVIQLAVHILLRESPHAWTSRQCAAVLPGSFNPAAGVLRTVFASSTPTAPSMQTLNVGNALCTACSQNTEAMAEQQIVWNVELSLSDSLAMETNQALWLYTYEIIS
jgi:hypothetical protein